jgi:glycosyltransferase involved in cell wall biosynthesis
MGTDATVIICTYNRADRLASALADLSMMQVATGTSWEIVVVDNCSSDNTRAVVEAAQAACPVLIRYHYVHRKGKSYALNSAIDLAQGEYLLFTDDDARIDPGWLEAILDVFSSNGCIGIGGRIVPEWECPVPKWFSLDGPYRLSVGAIVMFEQGDTIHDVYHEPFGANMAIHRSAFDRYGRFRTDLGPVGRTPIHGEDTEFCQRLLESGERLLYVPHAIVKHPVDGKRASKAYYRSWYFWSGVRLVRFYETFEPAVSCCGIPRYLLRQCGESALHWLFAVDPKRRFYHQLRTFMRMGEIWEFWRQWRDVKRKTGASHDRAGQSSCSVFSSPGTCARGSERHE